MEPHLAEAWAGKWIEFKMKKKKILFVITKWEGGVGRYVMETTKEIRKRGFDVKVISRDNDIGTGFLGSFLKLRHAVKHEKYDFLFTNDWSTALPLLGIKNHYCIFHGYSPNFPANVLQNLVYNVIGKRVIVVGDMLKRKYPKSKLIYEGVDTNSFKPKPKKKHGKTVGFVQNTEDRTYRFSVIRDALEKTGFELVVARGIPAKKMPDFYNSIDVFISIPDSRSGFNLCWLEAMACNTPTIGNTSGIGGKLPIIKISEPPNKKKVVAGVKKALKQKKIDHRGWLIDNGFTWSNCAGKITDFLLSGK